MAKSADKVSQQENVTQFEEKLDFDDDALKAIAEVYKNEGNDEYRKNEFSNAIHFYTEGIKVNCKDEEMNAKLYSNRATAHFRLGNYHESINDARAAVELQPTFIKAIARGASACMELRLYDEAITWCDKGLAINKNNKTLLSLRKSVDERNTLQKSQIVKGKKYGNSIKNRTDEEGGCTGIAYRSPEDLKKAKYYHEHCLKIAKQAGDRFNEGREYCNLGNVYADMGNFKKAIEYHEHCLKIAKETECRSNEGRTYCNLGSIFKDLGDFKRAVEFLEISLKIAIEVKDSIEEARACHNLGITHRSLKDFTKAIDYYERCLKISKEAEDRTGEGHTHGNIGNVYFELGNFEKAIECHECGLNLAKEVGDRYGEGRTYSNLGASYNSLGHFEKAVGYLESCVKIAKELEDRFAEGDAYRNLGNTYFGLEDFKKAIYFHERCLKIAKEDENKSTEASAHGNLGAVYTKTKDFKKAIDHFESGLKIAKEVKDRSEEGRAYCNLGSVYESFGNLNKAIYYHELNLKISKEEGDRRREGKACGDLGTAYISLGDLKKAVDYVKLSLQIAIELKDSGEEVRACNNLGVIYDRLGDFMKAEICHEKSLKILKEVKDRSGEKGAYSNLGNAYFSLGDLKKAIECYELSLQIGKELEDRSAEGNAYGNLGNAYGKLGDYEKAIHYHEHCLQISKELGYRHAEKCAYTGLSNDFSKLQNYKKSIEYTELSLKLAIEDKDRRGQGIAYSNLGSDYYFLGDSKKALKYHELALKIATEIKDRSAEGLTYGNIGLCHFKLGDYEKGIDYQRRNLQIAKEVDEMEEEGHAYQRLGGSLEYLGFLHEALDCYTSSVKTFNAMRARLQSKDEWKVSFSDKQQTIAMYTDLCSVLLTLDRPVEALCAVENGRARALNDLMVARYAIRRTDKGSSTDDETIQDILRGIQCEAIFPAFVKSVIHFWVIQNGKDVYSREEQVRCLSTRDEVVSYVKQLVETTLEDVGVRSGVNCEDRSLDTLRNPYSAEQNSNQTRSHSIQSQNHHLRNLYDVIIAPIADLIHGNEIIIVPEGPLWLAPFVALMDSNSKFLCESFRIRVIPSLTSLRLILDSPEDYHSKTGALLVGDPWVQEVIHDRGQKLDKLPYARREVEMIGRILSTAPLTGKEATKNEVLKRLSTVALVHIAAHGRMETGEIALCPNPLRASRVPTDEDFLLTISDVMNVKLTARLVVLSCCHSGRGEIKAEGVVGIARAFLGAGARSVLVSLWAIDDEATLEFMKFFYQHLVEGKSAGEALNQAMTYMRESENFSEVKYWAPFVLIGDDVTLEFAGSD